jgi:hypothetical protein
MEVIWDFQVLKKELIEESQDHWKRDSFEDWILQKKK